MKPRVRMKSEERHDILLRAAVKLAEKEGFDKVQRKAIAERAGCSESLVRHYFFTLPKMQKAIIEEAVRTENLRILAQGIVAKNPQCRKLPDELKQRALSSL